MTEAQLEQVAAMFKVLSEPARLRLISCLMAGGQSVTSLVTLSGLKQSNVSKHLKILCEAALLSKEKQGNFVIYAIAEPLLYELCGLMCQQVEKSAEEQLRKLTSG